MTDWLTDGLNKWMNENLIWKHTRSANSRKLFGKRQITLVCVFCAWIWATSLIDRNRWNSNEWTDGWTGRKCTYWVRCSERETERDGKASTLLRHHHIICSQCLLTTQTDGGSSEGRRIDVNENRTRCDSSASVYACVCVSTFPSLCAWSTSYMCASMSVDGMNEWMEAATYVVCRQFFRFFVSRVFTCFMNERKNRFSFSSSSLLLLLFAAAAADVACIVEALFRSLDYPFIRWASSRPLHFLVRLAVLCSWRGQLR